MNIDDMEGLDEATKTQIAAWQTVTREKNGGDSFAKAQFNIGSVYLENNNLESALKAWNKIERLDNLELYAQLRVDIGTLFKERDNADRALIEWKKVERLDDVEAYVRAQFYTGSVLRKKADDEGALKAWNNIKRNDNLKFFIEAQFHIAEILLRKNNNKGAITSWHNIKRSDDPTAFAKAQINIGSILIRENNIERALESWSNIERSDNTEIFAEAQFYIGYELHNMVDIDQALEVWSQIKRSDNPEVYAKAQFNIGTILKKQNDHEGALLAWRNIEYSDDSNSYTRAQFSIGNTLSDKGHVQGALLAWNSIKRSDNSETYARAKVKIGFLLESKRDYEGAIAKWSEIERLDDPEAYAVAQSNIGYLSFDTPTVAKKAFTNIRKSDNPRIHAYAQFNLGSIYVNENNVEEAKNSFYISKSYYPYESYCCEKICHLIEVSETENLGLSSLKLLSLVLDIVRILTLDFSKYADEEKPFERKLAHYTSTYTCNLLLGNDNKDISPSLFRLNTINNVNDPSEGQLLIRKLKSLKDNSFIPLDFDQKFHTFISCFTFNHDSLNQFRLYGKQDNKEASGMSLVFTKGFFQPTNFIGGLSYLSVENTSKIIKNISTINDTKPSNIEVQASDDEEIVKHSVMRCVYLDPTSDYFHLAQRNRLTFFREFSEKTIMKNGIEQSQAEYEWRLYQDYMKEVTDKFEISYSSLRTTYKEVDTAINNVKSSLGKSKQKELSILVDEILLPLKYLIKHSAFREEQECRMVYITSVDKPEVTMEYGSVLYVEYEPSVKDHLDKIYIAPAALHHKRYFDHILKDVDVPVEVSGNVFR